MNITPIGDKVALERIPQEPKIGEIYIPESVRVKSNWVRVKTLGTGKPGFEFTVKPGDEVLIPGHLRTDVDWSGGSVIIMKESELLAVMSSDA